MAIRRALYLLTSCLTAAATLLGPQSVWAQDSGGNAQPSNDPPTRVGRLAVLEGTVSTRGADDDHWSPAILNAPVFTGNAVWTEPRALAGIEIAASSLWMDGGTELDLTTLDDAALHAAAPQGELYVHLRSLQAGETFTVETPRGTVTLGTDGRYSIVAGDTQHPTSVSVLDGAAQVTGNNISLQVHAGQTASIDGDATFQGSVGPLDRDAFVTEIIRREQPAPVQGAPPPALVSQMTGGQDLNRYGAWEDSGEDGPVWYPQVDNDWVPYRDGRWSYVAPWGWTWVDAAPWGFAPFHYGRWVQQGSRWGWAPSYRGYGGRERAIYAPALVTFFGIGVGVGLGLHAGFGLGDRVGWVPLGRREAYYPPYRVSRTYVNRVNAINVRGDFDRTGRRDGGVSGFANSRFATVVPGTAMANSRPVRGAFVRAASADLSGAHALNGRPPIAPGPHAAGLTPRAAREWNLHDVEQRRAPGPQIGGPRSPAVGHTDRPALRDGRGDNARPVHEEPPNKPGAQEHGLPTLRGPSDRGERSGAPGTAPGPRIDRAAPLDHPHLRAPDSASPGAHEAARPEPRSPGGNRTLAPGARPEFHERPAARPEPRGFDRPAPHGQEGQDRARALMPRSETRPPPVQSAPRNDFARPAPQQRPASPVRVPEREPQRQRSEPKRQQQRLEPPAPRPPMQRPQAPAPRPPGRPQQGGGNGRHDDRPHGH